MSDGVGAWRVTIASVRAERLELVWLPPEAMTALREGRKDEAERMLGVRFPAGWPDRADDALFELRLEDMVRDPEARPWLARLMVLEDRTCVGHVGFHGKPDDAGAVEIGYTVFPEFRGRGYATEAAGALIDWARREHGIGSFRASVSPDNAASQRVLARLGFEATGRSHVDDVDGLELEFELHD